jgi:hypothetical protein
MVAPYNPDDPNNPTPRPPTLFNLINTCSLGGNNGTSQVSFTVNKVVAGSVCEVKIYVATDPNQGAVWSDVIGVATNARSFSLPNGPGGFTLGNGDYVVEAYNGEGTTTRTFTVSCTPTAAAGIPLRIDGVAASPASGFGASDGSITVSITDGVVQGANAGGGYVEVSIDNYTWSRAAYAGNGDQWALVQTGLPAGPGILYARDTTGATAQRAFIIGQPRRYRLKTAGAAARRYRLQIAPGARRYRLLTSATTTLPVRRYRLQTTGSLRRYRLQMGAALATGDFDIRITPDGDYLVVTVPQPFVAPTVPPTAPVPPIVQGECWDGTYYGGDLRPPAPAPAPPSTDWVFYLGPLATDGVYTVEVVNLAGFPDRKEVVQATLRLQLEHGRQLLLPPGDYNPVADEIELWVAAGTLAFEAQAYEEAHYIESTLYAQLLA